MINKLWLMLWAKSTFGQCELTYEQLEHIIENASDLAQAVDMTEKLINEIRMQYTNNARQWK